MTAAVGNASPDLKVGRVGRPHGLDGSFYVTRPLPRLLALGASVTVAGRASQIVRRAGTDKRPIVRLEGVHDRAGAEALRGLELTVAAEQAPALGEGEWWAHELEGCAVIASGRRLGTVVRVIALPSCEALEVLEAHGAEPLLVPLVKDAVRRIEAGEQRIEVDADFLGLPTQLPPEHPRAGDRSGD
jgi:16S rRNA processing protein RimM